MPPRWTSPSSRTDRKSTRLNSSHSQISYAVFCLKKKNGSSLRVARHRPGCGHGNTRTRSRARASRRHQCGSVHQPFPHGPHAGLFFFFNDTATTEIYTLSLHDALPIHHQLRAVAGDALVLVLFAHHEAGDRSEEHTSELQSQSNLVCRLQLEKKHT